MQSITGTFQDGKIVLPDSVNWPDGTRVEVRPLEAAGEGKAGAASPRLPAGFLDQLRADWGVEPFERPPQGESESREAW